MNARSVLALSAVLSSSLHASGVLVVDDSGGAPFTTIEAAILAAAQGDMILVRAGNYDITAIFGKSVSIVAETPGTVTLGAPSSVTPYTALLVKNLPANRPVVLSGLDFRASTGNDVVEAGNAAVRVENCLSPVIFQDCHVIGGRPGLFATQSVGVWLERTRVDAADGSSVVAGANGAAGVAVWATGASMVLHESELYGGDGSIQQPSNFGFFDFGSLVFSQGGYIVGGTGAPGTPDSGGACTNGGPGAMAVRLEGPVFHKSGGSIAGGAGGPPSGAPCATGSTGAAFIIYAGSVVEHSLPAPSIELPAWQHEGDSGMLTATGAPGSSALLFVGPSVGFVPSGVNGGALRLNPAQILTTSLGVFPQSGTMNIPYVLPHLPASVDVASVQIQIATLNGATAAIGGARALFVVDALIP